MGQLVGPLDQQQHFPESIVLGDGPGIDMMLPDGVFDQRGEMPFPGQFPADGCVVGLENPFLGHGTRFTVNQDTFPALHEFFRKIDQKKDLSHIMEHARCKGLITQLRIGPLGQEPGENGRGQAMYPQLLVQIVLFGLTAHETISDNDRKQKDAQRPHSYEGKGMGNGTDLVTTSFGIVHRLEDLEGQSGIGFNQRSQFRKGKLIFQHDVQNLGSNGGQGRHLLHLMEHIVDLNGHGRACGRG